MKTVVIHLSNGSMFIHDIDDGELLQFRNHNFASGKFDFIDAVGRHVYNGEHITKIVIEGDS